MKLESSTRSAGDLAAYRSLTGPELHAIAEVVLAAVYADAEFSEPEQDAVRRFLARLLDRRPGDVRVDALLSSATLNLSRDGATARMARAREVLTDPLTLRTLHGAAKAPASAGGLHRLEARMLDRIARELGLDSHDPAGAPLGAASVHALHGGA